VSGGRLSGRGAGWIGLGIRAPREVRPGVGALVGREGFEEGFQARETARPGQDPEGLAAIEVRRQEPRLAAAAINDFLSHGRETSIHRFRFGQI
jgi:hypothetical protein